MTGSEARQTEIRREIEEQGAGRILDVVDSQEIKLG